MPPFALTVPLSVAELVVTLEADPVDTVGALTVVVDVVVVNDASLPYDVPALLLAAIR